MRKLFGLLFILGVAAGSLRAQTSTHAATLNWTYTQGSDPATGFYVFRSPAGCASFTQLNATQLPVATLTYDDSTVNAGYSYCYRVTAVDGSGNQSAPSNTWTSPVVPVDPVTAVVVTRNATSNVVTWSASPDGGTITISRALAACGTQATYTQIATGLAGTTYTDSNPPASSNYCYSLVVTINGVNSSAAFGGVSVPPNGPTALSGTVR